MDGDALMTMLDRIEFWLALRFYEMHPSFYAPLRAQVDAGAIDGEGDEDRKRRVYFGPQIAEIRKAALELLALVREPTAAMIAAGLDANRPTNSSDTNPVREAKKLQRLCFQAMIDEAGK